MSDNQISIHWTVDAPEGTTFSIAPSSTDVVLTASLEMQSSMSTDDRSTQFRQFAKLLWDELIRTNERPDMIGSIDANDDTDPTDYLTLIAQRAYDFALHIVKQTTSINMDIYKEPDERILAELSDMMAWPLRENEGSEW